MYTIQRLRASVMFCINVALFYIWRSFISFTVPDWRHGKERTNASRWWIRKAQLVAIENQICTTCLVDEWNIDEFHCYISRISWIIYKSVVVFNNTNISIYKSYTVPVIHTHTEDDDTEGSSTIRTMLGALVRRWIDRNRRRIVDRLQAACGDWRDVVGACSTRECRWWSQRVATGA
jgi:hypothetical protein